MTREPNATAVELAAQVQNSAREAFREIARIPRGQFQSATARVGVLDRLRRFERLLAFGEGLLQRTEAGLGHKVGMRGNRPRRQAHLLCGLALSSRTNATLISVLL